MSCRAHGTGGSRIDGLDPSTATDVFRTGSASLDLAPAAGEFWLFGRSIDSCAANTGDADTPGPDKYAFGKFGELT